MKLKTGDTIREDDGIVTLVYKVVKVDHNKAIAISEFEGKTYPMAYKAHYRNPDNIRPLKSTKGINDLTTRKLVKE